MISHDTMTLKGLSTDEVENRLRLDGPNELPSDKNKSIFGTIFEILKEPMLLLLIGCSSIYLILGEKQDALMLSTFVIVVIGISIVQERKTEKALEALKNLSSPRALVVRNGKQERIPGREVVVGDLLIINEGDRIPADSRLLESVYVTADESLLTGESMPVRKISWDGKKVEYTPGGDDLPIVYSGTLITQGHGIGVVIHTGTDTEMGKIGVTLMTLHEEDTPLKKETARIVSVCAVGGLFLCLLIVLYFGLHHGDWIGGLLSGLTLGMAILPEEYSVVLVVFLALGAWRLSKRNVLTRKTAAIETLGAASVLCVDKTGTLTENNIRLDGLLINKIFVNLQEIVSTNLHEQFHALLEYAYLASQKDPYDPMDKAIKKVFEKYLSKTEHIHPHWKLVREYPLSKELLALSYVWMSEDEKDAVIAAKGAPEAIMDLCHPTQSQKNSIESQINNMSKKGYRCLAVAKARFVGSRKFPNSQHDFIFEYVGILGFSDPVRGDVKNAIQECYEAGIRVCMITGDYPKTAQIVGTQIGLSNPNDYMIGNDLKAFNMSTFLQKLKTTNIFARIIPEQKLEIVNAFKKLGSIVAMTGDGVNDAPALKSAHIGIAMGERGTDVAREAADIVLLNDNFTSIVAGIRLGRRIFDNLKKAMIYILAVHVPIAGMSIIPLLLGLPPVLLPAHIAFLELIIDPACSVVFESEKEEEGIMKRPPRDMKVPMFPITTIILSLFQGCIVLGIVLIVYLYVLSLGKGQDEARTITFVSIVIANLGLIITNLSWSRHFIKIFRSGNSTLLLVVVGAIVALIAVLYIPLLQQLFHFTFLHLNDITLAVFAGLFSILWFEVFKIVSKRFHIKRLRLA
jgi:P-type Ca2+ transporter type 2C